ncbi:MAG: hypothetical protein LBR16_07465 [Treponema sp.]|jgi:hypothetical protein|nr:hypothetical protein [Treponema sp.]
MKKKFFASAGCAAALCAALLAGCLKTPGPWDLDAPPRGAAARGEGADTSGPLKVDFVAEARQFKYTESTPLVMPDGTTMIKSGDLKPFWQWVEAALGIDISDVTTKSRASEIMQTQAATGFRDANIYGGNAVAADFMKYGAEGYFINLNNYIDSDMPHFKAYLEKNPNIRTMITAHDGGLYFLPYIAELNHYARVFVGRQSWVRALLDGGALETETASLVPRYEPFWSADTGTQARAKSGARHPLNVIALQNAAASKAGGALSFADARQVLLDYIALTYPDLQNPSGLYLGPQARHDIDELTALWRLVRLAPNTLSKRTTGAVVPGAEIIPYFFRFASYREDLLRLANYFEGQRVYGSDSYDARFYLDKDGVLQYSYSDDNLLDHLLPRFKALYDEGLLAPDFATTSLKENFRTIYFGGDLKAGAAKFGFMTFDFIGGATNVSLGGGKMQTDAEGILPPLTRIPGVSEGFVHFVENTRVIKPDGWAISSVTGGAKLRQALALFDFMFSEEGNLAQNFGTPDMLDAEPFRGPDGQDYPKMNQWFHENMSKFSNGDGAIFARSFVGYNFPIGYEKSIGFEQQFASPQGQKTWKLYEDAQVLSCTYDKNPSPYFSLVPPVFSMTERLQRQLLDTNISETQTDKIFSYITTNSTTIDDIKTDYRNGKIGLYVLAHRDAYAMMTSGAVKE